MARMLRTLQPNFNMNVSQGSFVPQKNVNIWQPFRKLDNVWDIKPQIKKTNDKNITPNEFTAPADGFDTLLQCEIRHEVKKCTFAHTSMVFYSLLSWHFYSFMYLDTTSSENDKDKPVFKDKHPQTESWSGWKHWCTTSASPEDWITDCSHSCEALTVSWPAMSAWNKRFSHWTSHYSHMPAIMLEQLSAHLWEEGTTEQWVKLSWGLFRSEQSYEIRMMTTYVSLWNVSKSKRLHVYLNKISSACTLNTL